VTLEHHPAWDLLVKVREALLAEGSPAADVTRQVVILESEDWIPPEIPTPFYALVLAGGQVKNETPDSHDRQYTLKILAVQSIPRAGDAVGLLGVPPYAPGARVGLLDLLWAGVRTIRGRGFGSWGWLTSGAESETRTAVDFAGEKTVGFTIRSHAFGFWRCFSGEDTV
jgi:hypothetical protein